MEGGSPTGRWGVGVSRSEAERMHLDDEEMPSRRYSPCGLRVRNVRSPERRIGKASRRPRPKAVALW